jgi:succinoglycan biosynthesis transport protein ExoP
MLTGRKQSRPIDDFEEQLDSASQGWPSRSLVRILWKRKVHVLVFWAALSALVIAVVMAWPATYRAETLILVDQQKIPEKFVSATVNAELQDRLATLSQEILSQTRLQKIIQTLNLYENERKTRTQEEILEMMAGDISVTAEKGWIQNRPGAFRVAYSGRNPATVAEVANQLGSLFIEENLRSRENMAEGTADFMKTQLDQAKKDLEAQEVKLSQFKQAYNGELPQQESSLAQELSQLQLQLQGSQDALNRANQNKTVVESALSVAQSTEATLQRLIENANHRTPSQGGSPAPKKKSEELETQLAAMKLRYSPAHPDIKVMMAEIEQAKATEAAESAQEKALSDGSGVEGKTDEAQDSPQSADAVRALAAERERVALMNAQLATLNTELKTRQADQQQLLQRIDSLQARVRRLPLREQEMTAVTRDYEVSKLNYKSLQDKIFAANMATDMERRQKSERFTILDPARAPEKAISPNRPLLTGAGSVLALFLSAGFWLLLEMRKNKFLGEWELPEGVVVLGRVQNIFELENGKGFSHRKVVVVSLAVAVVIASTVAAYVIGFRG